MNYKESAVSHTGLIFHVRALRLGLLRILALLSKIILSGLKKKVIVSFSKGYIISESKEGGGGVILFQIKTKLQIKILPHIFILANIRGGLKRHLSELSFRHVTTKTWAYSRTYLRIFRLTTSQSRKFIPKADSK